MWLRRLGSIGLSIVLSYVALLTIPYLWMAVPAALPFLALKSWKNAFTGFGIGALSAASVYLFYPLGLVSELSNILGSIAGQPPIIVLALYPLIYGVIFALSALLWSGVDYKTLKIGVPK
ncbi:hypothetical protein IX51_02930 [uncultured archaeon]|nr:hypothetical protein IX51_02930 [uncultured archaeon]